MEGKKQGWTFLIGVIGLCASLFSAMLAKAANDGFQPAGLTAKEKSILQVTLSPSGGDFSDRCKDSVAMMREQGDERSEEQLMSACLALPPDHAHICGIPREPGSYSILENDRCYLMEGGIQQHAHARKVPAREIPASYYEPDTGPGSTITSPDEDGNAGSAQ